MKFRKLYAAACLCLLVMASCSKKDDPVETPTPVQPSAPRLIFKFKFDSTQVRLNNFGQIATIPPGNSAQSPRFNKMSAHYIELAPDSLTALGSGKILYRAAETSVGGLSAIDFDSSVIVGEGQVFYSVPLSAMNAGTYRWLRVSLAYQNYDILFKASGLSLTGTIASFIGFNTFVRTYKVKDSLLTINSNKLQGYWAFETTVAGNKIVSQGQAPAGATTVPNPIAASSPIQQGSCVVTGAFASPLIITGNENHDIVITVSLSTNNSFEWKDANGNGIYEPLDNDTVADMGIRGLIPIVQ